jgi:hypothetical protein
MTRLGEIFCLNADKDVEEQLVELMWVVLNESKETILVLVLVCKFLLEANLLKLQPVFDTEVAPVEREEERAVTFEKEFLV